MDSGPQTVPRRVLAIDDDPVSLAIAAVLLEAEGCLVLQAASGEEALAVLAAESSPPDCVIADLFMPSLSGTDLALLIRQAAPGTLLLAMSANPPAHLDGYDGVLRKPLSPQCLQAAFAQRPLEYEESSADSPGDHSTVIDPVVFERLRRAMPLPALEEVVSAFLIDTSTRLEAMRSADPQALCRQAHTVRGGAAMVGAVQVSVVAAMIEAGIDHESDRLRKLDELEFHLRRAEQILKQRLLA